MLTPKETVMSLFDRKPIDRMPCFSGMGNVTLAGLEQLGIRFSDVHFDADKMAALAATTPELFGFDCAVVPFDVGVEAEALGCTLNVYESSDELLYPTVRDKTAVTADDLKIPANLSKAGRVPVVTRAIELLKAELGDSVPIGTYVLGPFTLAGQCMDLNAVLKMSAKDPKELDRILAKLTELIVELCQIYKGAGADYITIREMGASTGMVSPRTFRAAVKPQLISAIEKIPAPRVLHICGKTNKIVKDMVECGADAISVDHQNNMMATRLEIGDEPLVFGNLDGYNILALGNEGDVQAAVRNSIATGIDAVWPGCDIWPTAPAQNVRAMVNSVREFGTPR